MGSSFLYPFMDRGVWRGSLDDRTGKEAGVYTIITNQPTTGFPEGLSLEYGTLLYFKSVGGSGGNPEVQILVRTYPTDGVWIRGFWGGGSMGWKTISLT